MVFTNFGCLYEKKIQKKFLFASMKPLTNGLNPKIIPVTLFNRELITTF